MPRKRNKLQVLSPLSALCDGATLYLAMLLAFRLRFHAAPVLSLLPVTRGYPGLAPYLGAFAVGTAILVLMFRNAGFYARPRLISPTAEWLRTARILTVGFLIIMAMAFSYRSTEFSRGVVGLAWLTSFVTLGIERTAFNAFERWLYTRHHGGIRILLLGGGEAAARIADGVAREPRTGYRVAGWLQIRGEDAPPGLPRLGTIGDLETVIARERIHEVILATSALNHDEMTNVMSRCERELVGFKLVPDLFEILTTQLELTSINGIPVLGVREMPLDRVWNRALKRAFDLVVAGLGLFIAAPVIGLAAWFVRRDSPGPAIYRQQRLGENGRTFTLYKLRTMVPDAEAPDEPGWTVADDPRCTRAGCFLRRANFDELPQLWNVVRGDMSLVGPRPERPYFVEQFKVDFNRYMSRHAAKPGITGWAQVNGLRGDTSIRERVKYDLYYLENWSPLFDLKILLLTLLRAIHGAPAPT